jgi:hypothetical protein
MSMFIRRFLFDPGNEVLLEIESVNVLDLEPPSSIQGIGTGCAMIVGEFENGPFAEPTEVGSATELKSLFGGFGYIYGGVQGNNPCARSRLADGAIVAEKWNGNGAIQLSGKKFKRLLIVRVDTSVGEVTFTRLASLDGATAFDFNLASGEAMTFDDGGGPATATFTGVAATVTGAGSAPAAMTSGDTLVLGYDGADDFTVTFLSTDATLAAYAARINQYAGYTMSDVPGELRLTGLQKGTGGQVRVVSASAGVLAKTGLSVANTAGTGNVANIDAVTATELDTIISAANAAVSVEVTALGALRLVNDGTNGDTLEVTALTATALGFPVGEVADAATGSAGIIPAGTRVNKASGPYFVTMQDVTIDADSAGPYTVPVRHATDDGTGLGASAGTVVQVTEPITLGAFSVINQLPVAVAKTEAAIDAAYVTAIESTVDLNSVASEANVFWSARQSNAVRSALRTNVITASAEGCAGRMAAIRPPLNTLKATAKSTSAQPGVGAYRDQRVIYNYPGVATFIPPVAALGLAGGDGFTADGIVDVGSDGFMCSILSQLPPEENPGQETDFLSAVVSLERGANVQGMTITDYTQFKAKGIAAPRIAGGKAFFQSGVTSVDPAVNPGLKNIARRRMADFIQDTLSRRLVAFGKKTNKATRRQAIVAEIRSFMNGLMGKTNPAQARIAGYTLDPYSANTSDTLAAGIFRVILRIRTLSSLDSIVLDTMAGESVQVTELAALSAGP